MSARAEIAVLTDPGRFRPANEDAFTVDDRAGLLVVADGMGGEAGGEIASRLACDAVAIALASDPSAFIAAFAAADAALRTEVGARPELDGMGATMVAVRVDASTGTLGFAHAGDARVYLLRCAAGIEPPAAAAPRFSPAIQLASGATMVCLTRDHTSICELVERGHLDRAGGRRHPLRGRVNRALGRGESSEPVTGSLELAEGDRILLCSDGLWEMVEDDEIAQLLESAVSPAAACTTLIAAANDAGGKDNVTVGVIGWG